MIYQNLLDLVGNTPIYHYGTLYGNDIYVKLEGFNPALSVKDRVAKQMILDLEKEGRLQKDSKLVEATSGNTGIGLAFVSAVLGYSLTVVMPENMSGERINLMKAYGAKVLLTPKEKGMQGAEDLCL
jgi:cysteine synthase A